MNLKTKKTKKDEEQGVLESVNYNIIEARRRLQIILQAKALWIHWMFYSWHWVLFTGKLYFHRIVIIGISPSSEAGYLCYSLFVWKLMCFR